MLQYCLTKWINLSIMLDALMEDHSSLWHIIYQNVKCNSPCHNRLQLQKSDPLQFCSKNILAELFHISHKSSELFQNNCFYNM